MRYFVVATDYDGTVATNGRVNDATLAALDKVKASGRTLVLVTGRHLPDLTAIFSQLHLFDKVIVENGALLHTPGTNEQKLLCEPPPSALISSLQERKVPFQTGRGIIATWEPHQTSVLDTIRELGLDYQVIFNKGAVMVLPSGVNKATGLKTALDEMGLSLHNVVGIGDAENDHSFLAASECGVAVANALPALKDRADIVTEHDHGAGVVELLEQLLADDLARYDARLMRHSILLGTRIDDSGGPMRINPYRTSILVGGASASGKSTAVSGIVEQLAEQQYQFCLIDPEGDYEHFARAVSFGTVKERPDPTAVLKALEAPQSVVVNLLSIPVGERPGYFSSLLPLLLERRARTARPHWIIVDEAHHLLPSSWSPVSSTVPQALAGSILITVHPDKVSPAALSLVDVVIATGKSAEDAFRSFAQALHIEAPQPAQAAPETGQALIWLRNRSRVPILVKTHAAKEEHRRHRRAYAEGELSEAQSFYFTGPESKLHLRAQNLMIFLQLAEGVDDDTWLFHLRQKHYSRWFEETIKDPELAREAAAVEHDQEISAEASRTRIRAAIENRYTAPA
jgi:hydroxymethylpyrimidine pyrophosphatase-like HAD family hydrolase